jgi:peptidoglycan/xylan/chitin deacetylase (PgdA/CDA1 family)
MSQRHRGTVTLVFDDGYTAVYKNVMPLLDQYGIPGVFAVALEHTAIEQTENRPVTPWREWLKLQEQGHEIAAHSVSHRNLTNLSADELTRELREPASALSAHSLIYPGGAYSHNVIEEAKKYYRAARTVNRGFERKTSAHPWELKTYNFTRHNFSPWRANALATWAHLADRWLIETYHLVDDHESEKEHAVRLSDFASHLKFLSKLPVDVVTIKTMFGRHP